jgi:uncharacterized protein with PIN domain
MKTSKADGELSKIKNSHTMKLVPSSQRELFWSELEPQIQAYVASENIKARISEVWKAHDAKFNYEPNDPCPYCMGEAYSLIHNTFETRIEELKAQLGDK